MRSGHTVRHGRDHIAGRTMESNKRGPWDQTEEGPWIQKQGGPQVRHDEHNIVRHGKDHGVRHSQSSKLKTEKRLQTPPHGPGDPSFRNNFFAALGQKYQLTTASKCHVVRRVEAESE